MRKLNRGVLYFVIIVVDLVSFIFQLRVSNSKVKNKDLTFKLVTQSKNFQFLAWNQ